MREVLGRIDIAGVTHSRYPTGLRTPCGLDSTGTVGKRGEITCPVCAWVTVKWNVIDSVKEEELPAEWCDGTRLSYARGCGCEACRAAHNLYHRNYRERRAAA